MNNNTDFEKETNDKNITADTKTKKKGMSIVRIAGYVFAALCFLIGLVLGYPVGTSIVFIIVGILALPLTKDFLIKKLTEKESLIKKVRIATIVVLFLYALTLVPTTEKPDTDNNEDTQITSQQKEAVKLTDDMIKSLVSEALYDEIDSKKRSGSYRSSLDPAATRYEIASVESKDTSYVVYGNGYFYDKYGHICTPYNDNSGDSAFNFEVTISKSTGKVQRTKLKL